MDVPSPPLITQLLGTSTRAQVAYHVVRNTVFGAIASFLVWGGYNPQATFNSVEPTVGQIVASLIVGGGGVTIVNSYFRQAQQEAGIKNLTESLSRLVERVEQGNSGDVKDGG